MPEGQLRGETRVETLHGLGNALIGIGDAQSGGQFGKKLVFVDHVRIDECLDQRLAIIRGQFERVAESCGLLASGAGGGADEDVDQGGGGHGGGYNAKP